MYNPRNPVFIRLLALAVGLLLGTDIAAAQDSVWWIGRTRQGPDLSAVYALSWESGKKYYEEHLWVGDDEGNFGVVQNPDVQGVFRLSTSTVGASDTRPRAKRQPFAINGIYFRDPGYGFLLKGNTIYETRTGGRDWVPLLVVPPKNGASPTLYSLSFFPKNPRRGCVVGVYSRNSVVIDGLVLCGNLPEREVTANWQKPVLPPHLNELLHITLVNDKYGWIVGSEGTILNTSDAGASWETQNSQTDASLFHAHFVSENRGWVVGEHGTILRTKNGGKTWLHIPHPVLKDVSFISVMFADDDKEGWIVGHKGVILHTINGGSDKESWELQASKTQEDLYALFVDRKYCWAVGGKGAILRYELSK